MTDNPFDADYREPEQGGDVAEETDVFGLKPVKRAGIVYHDKVTQGSEEWYGLRLGLLTASEMGRIITPSLKPASNKDERSHLYELLAQRVTQYVEPTYQSFDMERGNFDEEHARKKYAEKYAPVKQCGIVTNDKLGFNIGYSPDGLVASRGQIECKSRIQKWQMQTILECIPDQTIPADYMIQIQTGLFVTEREWCDFISFSSGMMMLTIRAYPIPEFQAAIAEAATQFEKRLNEKLQIYNALIEDASVRLTPTERLIHI